MELYQEILSKVLSQEKIQIIFPDLRINASEIVEGECYRALKKIREIICDDTLEDEACFLKIEKIVCLLEDLGSNGGIRHDFG